jgi:hypothetical protein
MSIPGFGRIMPIHFEILGLIGWRLSPAGSELIASELERIEEMRKAHADLVRTTGQDFGYDLAKWRDFFLAYDEQFGYRHPYAFATVDRAVRSAIADPTFPRLGAFASAGGSEWDAQYCAKRERERQARTALVATNDALITKRTCPACGMPLPGDRRSCEDCGTQTRRRVSMPRP